MKKMPRLAATVLLVMALLVPAVHVTANPDSPTATPTWMDLLASRCQDWLSALGPSILSAAAEAPPTDFSPEPGANPGDTTLTTTSESDPPQGEAAPSADPDG